ncbi:MAG: ABC transporter permease [Candidatus Sumerlaeia bacterium]|nr:ABC transporter permease [Candidatus Sumerlaeia bacterium]
MLFWTIVKVALKSLLANKLRSFLAMLGIIIGVGAVISMLAMGAGAKRDVMKRITAMGTNLLVVRPGQRGSMGVMSGSYQTLTLEDAQALVSEVKGIQMVAPVVRSGAQVKYLNKNSRVSVIGSSITYFPIRNFEIERGRAFTEVEVEHMARVAVLGPVTVENLFGSDNPLNEVIKINNINFRVIGVLKSKGDQGWFNPDDTIIIPYTTAMKQLFGLDRLNEINIKANDVSVMQKVLEETTRVLRKRHRIPEDKPDDFEIRNQAEMVEMASNINRTFTILLGSIASISLLVGGIGIMNIMLVTVTERTREIGVRKAIGAKERDILLQFLIEALTMSAVGGLIGVAFGVGAAHIIGAATQFSTLVQLPAIILALSFSAAVGIFFGFYPARRAAQLDPIEALRYE